MGVQAGVPDEAGGHEDERQQEHPPPLPRLVHRALPPRPPQVPLRALQRRDRRQSLRKHGGRDFEVQEGDQVHLRGDEPPLLQEPRQDGSVRGGAGEVLPHRLPRHGRPREQQEGGAGDVQGALQKVRRGRAQARRVHDLHPPVLAELQGGGQREQAEEGGGGAHQEAPRGIRQADGREGAQGRGAPQGAAGVDGAGGQENCRCRCQERGCGAGGGGQGGRACSRAGGWGGRGGRGREGGGEQQQQQQRSKAAGAAPEERAPCQRTGRLRVYRRRDQRDAEEQALHDKKELRRLRGQHPPPRPPLPEAA
mmetsp:Transcript_64420/g.151718  ORF Transcript_64420/g.151718 Transcript_64420/m.151718 type:complete len:309 (+) Transcript_64420:783-1709(+)